MSAGGEALERYDGEWIEDSKSGYGEYCYANKDVYKGQWSSDQRHGQGTIFYFDNPIHSVTGLWREGQQDSSQSMETVFRDSAEAGSEPTTKPPT